MFLNILAIALFILPGAVSELYYLSLIGKDFKDNRPASITRGLGFSMAVLLIRCLISMSRGYGDLLVQELFWGIGNVGKYIMLSGVMSLLMPNACLLVRAMLKKQIKKEQVS